MTNQNKLVGLGIWPEAAEQIVMGDIVSGLTAAGSTQATALVISADLNIFSTVAASTGAVLVSTDGARIMVRNAGANTLLVYAPVGGYMNDILNGSLSVPTTKNAAFYSRDGISWYSLLSA